MPPFWTDRAGRFAPLKFAVFWACCAPMLWLGALALVPGGLGSKPLTFAIHETGDWAVRLLLLSLLVTPLRSMAGWPGLIAVRRMVGLAALAYVAAHLVLYVAEQAWNLPKVASEIVLRFYLTVGFVALVGLAVLGATSTDAMIRRLGSARWNRLHSIVYALTALSILHFFLQSRLDVSQPVLMTGFFLWLMGWRFLRKRVDLNLGWLLALALASALLTALVEAGWYAVRNGAPVERVLLANLDVSFTIRPALWVLASALAMAGLFLWRGRPRERRRLGPETLAIDTKGN